MWQLRSLWIWRAGKCLALNTPQKPNKSLEGGCTGVVLPAGRGWWPRDQCPHPARQAVRGVIEVRGGGKRRGRLLLPGGCCGTPAGLSGHSRLHGRGSDACRCSGQGLGCALSGAGGPGPRPSSFQVPLRMELATGSPLHASFIEQRNGDRDTHLRGVQVSPRPGRAGKK